VSQPYFSTSERIAQLISVANEWRETPWCANSHALGSRGGVSCHNLPREIFIACGALPEAFPQVIGDPNGTRHTRQSVMEPFLDSRSEFQRLAEGEAFAPGDLLGLRIYHCIDHLGIYLGPIDDGLWFVHVLMHKKTDFDLVNVPPWSQRILAAWRPIEN
jgi:hypothetical protein